MTTVINMTGRKILVAAASLAFVPLMAFSQDKASTSPPSSSAAPGQSAGSATSAAGTSGAAGTGAKENASGQSAKPQNTQKTGTKSSTAFLLIPVNAPEQNQWMKKGCWAKFYDDQNFSGDSLTLMGPVDMPDITGPFGIDWKGKISSVETGAKARVLVYDNENFKDLVSTFKPGQKSSDVSKKMGFFDEFSSIKIACDNVQAKGGSKS